MSWSAKEAQQIGRIETKVDQALAFAPRITALETWVNRGKGILAFLSVIGSIVAVLLISGCAYATQTAYFQTGEVCARTRSFVVGTGETEQVSNACGDYGYSTRHTGLSNNGTKALGEIAEGAVGALVPAL
ncbi:MAG: hypothetical protein V3W02_05200 [Gammaproteobacteria bacterium]